MPPDTTFLNFYECPDCGHSWQDAWSCTPDDDCPECGTRHVSPYKSTRIEEPDPDGQDHDRVEPQ